MEGGKKKQKQAIKWVEKMKSGTKEEIKTSNEEVRDPCSPAAPATGPLSYTIC